MNDLNVGSGACTSPQAGQIESTATAKSPVLVAVDLSGGSDCALIWARGFAASIGAPLEVLHVVHDPADSPGTYKPENGDSLEPMTDVAKRKLVHLIKRVDQEGPNLSPSEGTNPLCVQGLPVPTILQIAITRRVRHLVLGGRQRKGLSRMLHGSVAHRIVGEAQVPVTIVKMDG